MDNNKKTSYKTIELQDMKLDFSHDEIFENLKNENCEDFIKIFSIINLEEIKTIEEAQVLFHHLTNHPTPIREAVALKLEEKYDYKFFNNEIKEQFLKSIIDINPNVCRSICAIVAKFDNLKNNLADEIILKIKNLLSEIEQNDKELGGFYEDAQKIRKNHAKNKKLFSLYWYLECLSICIEEKNNSEVLEILKETIKFNDYTIREKTAKILAKLKNKEQDLLQIAIADENFYVKKQVYDKINFED